MIIKMKQKTCHPNEAKENLSKWLFQIDKSFGTNVVPQSEGAGKFLGKYLFVPCVATVITDANNVNTQQLEGIVCNVNRLWFITNEMRKIVYDDMKTSFMKYVQWISYISQVIKILTNVCDNINMRCGLDKKNGW